MMPKTLFDKIWEAHLVATRADGRALIYMDRHLLDDVRAPHAFQMLERQGRTVRRKDLTMAVQDHSVSTASDRATRIDVVATYEDGVHVLRPIGLPIEVRRWRDGDEMIWEYLGFTARLQRIAPPDAPWPER